MSLSRQSLLVAATAAVVIAMPLMGSTASRPAVIFVDDDFGNVCPGSGTAGDPFCSIQDAIADPGTVNGDEVVVAPGTYFESINFNAKAITVRSTDPTNPAIVAATIIDGGGVEFHVVQCVFGEGPDTVLDGFTITGGNANGAFPDNIGGGMYNDGSSPRPFRRR